MEEAIQEMYFVKQREYHKAFNIYLRELGTKQGLVALMSFPHKDQLDSSINFQGGPGSIPTRSNRRIASLA